MRASQYFQSGIFAEMKQPASRYNVFDKLAILLPFLYACPCVRAQTTDPKYFPERRHEELTEELNYTPPKQKEDEDLDNIFDNIDFNWDIDLSQPETLGVLLLLLVPLGYLIYRILGIIDTRRRDREAGEAVMGVDINEIEEEVLVARGVERSLLQRAEDAGQFDIATRLLYIQLLKELNDGGLIKYRKDLSNRDYQRQLTGQALLPDFRTVTSDYERYWYGKYPIDKLTYRGVRQRFDALTIPLNQVDA